MTSTTGSLIGLAVAVVLGLIARRVERQDHARKLEVVQRKIRAREAQKAESEAEDSPPS